MNKFVYPFLVLLAGAVQINLLPSEAVASTVEAMTLGGDQSANSQQKRASVSVEKPKLVVLVTVSGLDTDLLSLTLRNTSRSSLLDSALFYTNLRHPLLPADPVSSAAILHTGTLSSENGVPSRRPLRRPKNVPADRSQSIFYSTKHNGIATMEKLGPDALQSSTILDAIKRATGGSGISLSVAIKSEEAILAGGQDADGAFWIDETRGTWAGSDYYPLGLPWYLSRLSTPGVKISSKGYEWVPFFPDEIESKYGKWVLVEVKEAFRHSFKRVEPYLNTPPANQEVTLAALSLLDNAGLGTDGNTDVLALSYSLDPYTLPEVSAVYPSPELIDGYYRLEDELDKLRRRLPNETLFVLMGDGMAQCPLSGSSKTRLFHADKCKALTNMYLDTIYGVKGLVKEVTKEGQLYLDENLIKSKGLDSERISEDVAGFLSEFAGVSYAYPKQFLRQVVSDKSVDRSILTALSGVLPRDRGDVVFGLLDSYLFSESGNFSGKENLTPSYFTIPSPLIILGSGVEAERIDTPLDLRGVSEVVCRVLRIRPPTN